MLLVVTYSLKSLPRPSVLATRRHPRKLWSVTCFIGHFSTSYRLRPTHLGWAAHGIQASSLKASSPHLAEEDLDFHPLSKHCFLALPSANPRRKQPQSHYGTTIAPR